MKVRAAALFGASAVIAMTALSFYLLGVKARDRAPKPFVVPEVPITRIEGTAPEELRNQPDAAWLPERDLNARVPGGTAVDAGDADALEMRWYGARATADRREIAENLAAENDEEAVRVIGRLLDVERHPELRRALLSSLTEIDPSIAVDERLMIVQKALRSPSPQIRAIALAALDALDDPRVSPLLARLSQEDADSTVRVVAAKMIRARAETEAAFNGDRQ